MGTKRKEPYRSTYRAIKYSAKKRNLEFTLTPEEFYFLVQIRKCFYCGGTVDWSPYGRPGATNLDRKDNTKGYTFDNVAVCCFKCNTLKSNFWESEEFKLIIKIHELWQDPNNHDELTYLLMSWQDNLTRIISP